MNTHQTTVSSATLNAYRLVLLAMVAAAATFSIAVFYPGSQTADEAMELSFGAAYGFIVAQSFVLTLPGLVLGLVLSRLVPRTGAIIGTALIFAVPVIVVCDVLTFAWIGERFLSQAMHRITTTLAPGLALHITRSTVVDAVVAVLLGLAAMVVAWWISGRIAHRWARSRDPVGPWATTLVMTVVAGLLSIPAVWNLPRTIGEMENQSVRHPLCAFHIVGYRGTGVSVPRGDEATLARLRGLQSAPAVQQIDSRQLQVALDSNTRPSKPAE